MAASVWEYFVERQTECESLSLAVDSDAARFWEREGSNGTQGRILMTAWMSDAAFLSISELVVCRASHIERLEYGYYLIIDGEEYCSWDRDSFHGYHKHGLGHKRYPGKRITFKQVVEKCWHILSEEEHLADAVPDAVSGEDD